MNIMDAPIPSQRWALPTDSDWDIYADEYELWLNEHYDMKGQMIMGRHMTWEQACEDEWLFDDFMEMKREAAAEARAEDAYYDDRGYY